MTILVVLCKELHKGLCIARVLLPDMTMHSTVAGSGAVIKRGLVVSPRRGK